VPKDRERKIGHRRYNEKTGEVTYKKVNILKLGVIFLDLVSFPQKGEATYRKVSNECEK